MYSCTDGVRPVRRRRHLRLASWPSSIGLIGVGGQLGAGPAMGRGCERLASRPAPPLIGVGEADQGRSLLEGGATG